RLEDLRRQFAVVPQDPVLFSASIAENIAYARPGASESDVVAAAQAANAHEFIVRLPQGYDTQVGERGVQLSGGQRQRIAIARAFLKDSPVLILDEPTSAVDLETEAAIVGALERLQQGRTVVIISHRPTTLAGCSAVLTIEHGRVVRDTTRALEETGPIRPTPKRAPALAATGRRLESVLAHPAVQAWRRLGHDRPIPDRVAPATRRRGVYRLEGAGAEGSGSSTPKRALPPTSWSCPTPDRADTGRRCARRESSFGTTSTIPRSPPTTWRSSMASLRGSTSWTSTGIASNMPPPACLGPSCMV